MRGESIGYSCNWKKEIMFSSAEINDNHLISENGKIAALISGRPAFQQHVKRAEGSDTPHLARSESTAHRVKKQQHHQVANRSRSPAGPRRLGTATRISASLSRRLSAFFESASGQDPKAAKFAVLTPGRAGFTKRTERSEGSDTTPHTKQPLFCRVCPCVRFFEQSRVCTHFHS